MKSVHDKAALQGIEFWSSVCDEETDLAIEAVEAAESGHPPDQTSKFYVKGAMAYLVPILLEILAKQVMCCSVYCAVIIINIAGCVRRILTMKMTGILAKLQVCASPS